MFKRCIARVLIFLQIYSALFQGILHAEGILHGYAVRDEIYLHGAFDKAGGLRLALGTGVFGAKEPEFLGTIEIPSYESLKKFHHLAKTRSSTPDCSRAASVDLSDSSLQQQQEYEHETSSIVPERFVFPFEGEDIDFGKGSKKKDQTTLFLYSKRSSSSGFSQSLSSTFKADTEVSDEFAQLLIDVAQQGWGKEDTEDDDGSLSFFEIVNEGEGFDDSRSISPASIEDFEEEGPEETAVFTSKNGITRAPDGVYFTLQGLNVFMKDTGDILIQGKQTDFSKPIFLSGTRQMILDNVEAQILQLTAPSFLSTGSSVIESLTLEGTAKDSTFTNTGTLATQESFLKGLNSGNIGTLSAALLQVTGEFASTGTLENEELVLGEGAFLTLVDGGKNSFETVFLGKNSRLENNISDPLHIQTLVGQQGSLINNGWLVVEEVLEGSAFESILNRQQLSITHGKLPVHYFENDGVYLAPQSPLSVLTGRNAGFLSVASIQVDTVFENEKMQSRDLESLLTQHQLPATPDHQPLLVTQHIAGQGLFKNLGRVESEEELRLGVREMTNSSLVIAASINGLATLEKFVNIDNLATEEEGYVEATESLQFTETTELVNSGTLTAKQLQLVAGKITQKGTLSGHDLILSGDAPFENHQEIEMMGTITLNVPRFINHRPITAASIEGTMALTHFENISGVTLTLRGGRLKTLTPTAVVNRGAIVGGIYDFAGPYVSQLGTLKGKSLTLAQTSEFENVRETEIKGPVTLGSTFVNLDRFKAESIIGLDTLKLFKNSLLSTLTFSPEGILKTEEQTEVINEGAIIGGVYAFKASRFTQLGSLKGKSLSVSGDFSLDSLGAIEMSEGMDWDITELINSDVLKAASLTTSSRVKRFENAQGASIVLKGGPLKTAYHTKVINEGSITGGSYEFNGPVVFQHGILKGKSLELFTETILVTEDGQEMDILEPISMFHQVPLLLKGKIHTPKFSLIGTLDLLGELIVDQDFDASGIIQPTGRLFARNAEFSEEMSVLGELEVMNLTASKKLTIPGKAKVKRFAIFEDALCIPVDGKLIGMKGDSLYLEFKGTNDIAGFVDTDYLITEKPVTVRPGGRLISRVKTTLKENLSIARGAEAELYNVNTQEGVIENEGTLSIFGQEKGTAPFIVRNKGQALLDAMQGTRSLETLQRWKGENLEARQTLPVQFINEASGILHVRNGEFAAIGEGHVDNRGTFIQEGVHLWFTTVKNIGHWSTPNAATILKYDGKSLGVLEVEKELTIDSTVDGIVTLDSLSGKTKAAKITVRAPSLLTTGTGQRQYPWVVELILADAFNNTLEITAPKLSIRSRTFKTTGDLFSSKEEAAVDVLEDMELAAHIYSPRSIETKARRFKIVARTPTGQSHPNILYRRNGNGLYSPGPIVVKTRDVLDNQYGIIQGASYLIEAPRLINLAGLISATDPRLRSELKIGHIQNIRDEAQVWAVPGCKGHLEPHTEWKWVEVWKDVQVWKTEHVWKEVTKNNFGRPLNEPMFLTERQLTTESRLVTERQRTREHQSSTSWNTVKKPNCFCQGLTASEESSDEGVIDSKGDLILTYTHLEMLVSRISCGGNLTFVAGGRSFSAPLGSGAVNLSILPGQTTMKPRHNKVNHIAVKGDFAAGIGIANLTATVQARNATMHALELTLQGLGRLKKRADQVFNISDQMRRSDALNIFKMNSYGAVDSIFPQSSPEEGSFPSSVVVVGKDAKALIAKGKLHTKATSRAINQQLRFTFSTQYFGKSFLDFRVPQLFSHFGNIIRGKAGTVSQRCLIKDGQKEHEVEALCNPDLTPEDVVKYTEVGAFLFLQNLNAIGAEKQAEQDIEAAQQVATMLAVRGVNPNGVEVDDKVGLVGLGDVNLNTNLKGKKGKVISLEGSTRISATVERESTSYGFIDRLIPTNVEMKETFENVAEGNVVYEGVHTWSGLHTEIESKAGMVANLPVETISQSTYTHGSRKSKTTTTTTQGHQNPTSHGGTNTVTVKGYTAIRDVSTSYDADTTLASLGKIDQEAAVDWRNIQSRTKTSKGSWFGGSTSKTSSYSSASTTSKGGISKGKRFVVMAGESYKATKPTYQAPTDITAPKVAITLGVNTFQSVEQTVSEGLVWTKSRVEQQQHTTHSNPNFENNVYIHAPEVIVERVRGSASFSKLFSDTPVHYVDRVDQHHSMSKSQRNLSASMQLLIRGAVSLALGNPFAASSVQAAMLNAGYMTLCSDMAVNLVEQGGNLGRTLQAMEKNKAALNVARAMATAGLVRGVGVGLGISQTSMEFIDCAKREALRSAVNTVVSVSVDGQDFKQALLQGMASAGINTIASWGAHKIGDMGADSKADDRISTEETTMMHVGLGGITGGITAAAFGKDITAGISSGMTAGLAAEITAKTALRLGMDTSAAIETASLVSGLVAFATNQDVGISMGVAENAARYNCVMHYVPKDEKQKSAKKSFLEGLEEGEANEPTEEQQIYERGRQRYVSECLKEAQQRRGRALSDRSRERVEESANKFFSRSHASVEALSMMTDPKNILLAGSYIPGVPGAIAGMGEAAYGVHKGTHDMMDATQAVVSGSMGFVQKGYRNLKHGTALVKSFKKTGGTGHKLSTAEAQKLLKGTSKISSAPTIESLAAKYGGASEQKKSLRFVEMMQEPSALTSQQVKPNPSFLKFDAKASTITKKSAAHEKVRLLLPGEGKVDTFRELSLQGSRGDNLSAHHMPNSQYMQTKGVSHAEGISMTVEHPVPGTGGRHREIHKELIKQDPALEPRDALAQSVIRAREVYQADGALPKIRPSLLEVIDANKKKFPELFQKEAKE